MNLPEMQRIQVNGVTLESIDRGSGEPVVLIHGSMGDECFAVLEEPALTEGRRRLIHYHRRGWGADDCPDAPVSMEQQSLDCQALLAHLAVKRAHFVGQSYGAVTSLQVALDAPDLVHSLSLLEPSLPGVLTESEDFAAVAERAGSQYESGDKEDAVETFAREVAGADYRTEFGRTLPTGSVERWMAKADTLFLSELPGLMQWSFTREEAGRITQPVLNMTGANTTSYFRECHETVKTWMPHAENYVVPDATHCMMQNNPRAVAEQLAAFFTGHPM